MVRRLIVITLTAIIFTTNPGFVAAAESSHAPDVVIEEAIQQQILSATLRITMIASDKSAGEPAYAISNGLGTLVQDGDTTYIVTHDHWSRLAKKVRAVRIESAAGELLLDMTPDRFYSLIRYRDGGTMVMVAPPELPDYVRAVRAAADQRSADEAQTLAIAYWQPEAGQQVSVEPVTIEKIEDCQGNASMKMRSVNGRVVVQGNSGGGVFLDGQLVGNMWETIVVRDQESDKTSNTDMSRAARFTYDEEAQDELLDDMFAAPTRGGAF